jgi:hypothetical protein
MNQIIRPGVLKLNLSPDAFHRYATHYLKCKRDFQCPDKFSPVPYFLLCRAIELEIKARHLKHVTQKQVKDKFWHKFAEAYDALEPAEQILNQEEERTLRLASDIYNDNKRFEYFFPMDALTAYKWFPDLALLDAIASKLIGI